MQKWLDQVRTIEAGDPGNEAAKIITPYGLELEVDMDPDDGSAEYTGEGDWEVDSWGEEDWGIYYNLPGTVSGVRDPDEVGGTFILDNNILHNLEGITPTFTGWLHIDGNKLVSLEGLKKCKGITCYDNTVSTETLYLIFDFIQEYLEMGYGAILAALQSRISQEDWEKLDKSSLDKMNQTRKKVYGMLGGIGGI